MRFDWRWSRRPSSSRTGENVSRIQDLVSRSLVDRMIGEKKLHKNGSKIPFARPEHQEGKVPWLFVSTWKWPPFSGMCHYWWRVLGVWVLPRNQAPEYGVAHLTSPRPKKARLAKLKIKCMLICYFLYPRNHPQIVSTSRSNGQSTLLPRGSWKTLKRGHLCETKHQEQVSVASQ